MLNFPREKLYNSYIIETNNYDNTKNAILEFAKINGFDSTLVDAGTHPDILFVESYDKKIEVASIKEGVVNAACYTPSLADHKFYVIYDAIYLDENSQNAMLKTLEEPKEYNAFFLVTTNASKLLDTIRSRCFFIQDFSEEDVGKIADIEFFDDAVLKLANLKYESVNDLMNFAETFEKREDLFKDLIKIYRYVIRDAFAYKKTLSKELINLKKKETEIISIANAFTFSELGTLSDKLSYLSELRGYAINKKIAVFNFLSLAA